MVMGASAAGARVMTSTSSPGMALKQEGISYLSGAQLPAVVVNMMRGAPALVILQEHRATTFRQPEGAETGITELLFSVQGMFRNWQTIQ